LDPPGRKGIRGAHAYKRTVDPAAMHTLFLSVFFRAQAGRARNSSTCVEDNERKTWNGEGQEHHEVSS